LIGLLDFGGAGLVQAALGDARSDVHVLADLRRAASAIASHRVDALIVECPHSGAELDDLLQTARTEHIPVLIVGRDRGVSAAVQLLRAGAHDYVVAPFEYESLLEAIARLQAACAVAPAYAHAQSDGFTTGDPDLLATLDLVRSVAATDATVLIEGESGTGKELLARMVHQTSRRAKRELVSLNCAALPPGLLESELFGHERGAFTGAFQRVIGKFELADGATLLLDEIGELELGLQAKLLRVVQEKQVQRVGAPRPHLVDFRLVATTNRDLATLVKRGQFREDLYYRLNVVPVRVKPLRERRGDVRRLIDRFLERRGHRAPILPLETLAALEQHGWPGNVRELENLIERLSITHAGRSVRPADLPFLTALVHAPQPDTPPPGSPPEHWTGAAPASESGPQSAQPPFHTLREMERWLIVRTLAQLQGNRTRAARELGISLRTLRNKIHEYQIAEPETLPRTGTNRPAGTRQHLAGQELPAGPRTAGAAVR
jgi:two-component system response regulator FlrC